MSKEQKISLGQGDGDGDCSQATMLTPMPSSPCPPVPAGELSSPAPHSMNRMKCFWMTALYFLVFRVCINEICRSANQS